MRRCLMLYQKHSWMFVPWSLLQKTWDIDVQSLQNFGLSISLLKGKNKKSVRQRFNDSWQRLSTEIHDIWNNWNSNSWYILVAQKSWPYQSVVVMWYDKKETNNYQTTLSIFSRCLYFREAQPNAALYSTR
jgi:hypothetical protein